MANNRNALTAGIFMILSVAAAIAIIIFIVGGNPFALHLDTHLVSFKISDNLNGLRKGDDVRIGGMKVGTVDEIQLVQKDEKVGAYQAPNTSLLVRFSMPHKYLLATDATIGIESSLTGLTSLNISDLGEGSPLPAQDPLPGQPDSLTSFKAALADLGPKLKQTVPKVNGVSQAVEDLTKPYKELGEKVNTDWPDIKAKILERVKQLTDSAVAMLGSIRDFFGGGSGDFHKTLANAAGLTSSIKEKLPPMEVSIQEFLDNLNSTMLRLQGSVDNIKATIANAKDLTAGLESVVARNQGRIDEIATGVKRTVNEGEGFFAELRDQPWRLIYRPTGDLSSNLNVYDAARQFAEGANDLEDASTALRDALRDNRADPAKVQKLYDDLQKQFDKFKAAEDNLWKQVH